MYHIQKTCGGDLKPGLRLSEGRDTWSRLQGATQQVILSQEGTASKAEMHVVGHQKTSSARGENRGQSTELVSTWTSRAAQQGRQESHLPRNIKTATLDWMPQSKVRDIFFSGQQSISFPVWAAAQHSFLLTSLFPLDKEHTRATILINAITKGPSLHAAVQHSTSGSMTEPCTGTPWYSRAQFDLHQILVISKYSLDSGSGKGMPGDCWQPAASLHTAHGMCHENLAPRLNIKALHTHQRGLKSLLNPHEWWCSLVLLIAWKERGKRFCLYSSQSCSAMLDTCLPPEFMVTPCCNLFHLFSKR